MKSIISNLKTAAIVSLFIVLPFAILEAAFNKVRSVSDFIALFGFLWLLSTAALALLMPIAQNLRAGRGVAAKPLNLLLRIGFSALIIMMWTGIVIDQLPCFLGVPNCD
jgi:hypothetical protein